MASQLNVESELYFCKALERNILTGERVIRSHLDRKKPLFRGDGFEKQMLVKDALSEGGLRKSSLKHKDPPLSGHLQPVPECPLKKQEL